MSNTPFEVIDLDTDEPCGEFCTLADARKYLRSQWKLGKLSAYAIWNTDTQQRLEHCEPYRGDDDRIKQSLGMPNASEAF